MSFDPATAELSLPVADEKSIEPTPRRFNPNGNLKLVEQPKRFNPRGKLSLVPRQPSITDFTSQPNAELSVSSPMTPTVAAPSEGTIQPLSEPKPLNAQEIEEILMTPNLNLPEGFRKGLSKVIAVGMAPIMAPLARGHTQEASEALADLVAGGIETLSSPGGAAIIPAQGIPVVNTIVDSLLAASLAKSGAQKLGEASVTGDVRTGVTGAGELLMGGLSGAGAGKTVKPKLEVPVQHETVLPGASETFKEITREPTTTKGAENAQRIESSISPVRDVLRSDEGGEVSPVELPKGVDESGQGVRSDQNQGVAPKEAEVVVEPALEAPESKPPPGSSEAAPENQAPVEPTVSEAKVSGVAAHETAPAISKTTPKVSENQPDTKVSETPEIPKLPKLPKHADGLTKAEKDAEFNRYIGEVDKYNADLQAWEAAQPTNKPILFKSSTGGYTAITKDPQGGWRATTFSQLFRDDPRYAPWGHERYTSRLKAVKEHVGELVSELPEVMTEAEIRAKNEARVAAQNATKGETPAKAAAKVEAQVKTVAKTEGQRSAKEVKSELVARIEDAMHGAPEKSEWSESKHGYVEINIPGDGNFRIARNLEALGEIRKRAERVSTATTSKAKTVREASDKITPDSIAEDAKRVYGEPRKAISALEKQIANPDYLKDAGINPAGVQRAIEILRDELPENILDEKIKASEKRLSELQSNIAVAEERMRVRRQSPRGSRSDQIFAQQQQNAINNAKAQIPTVEKELRQLRAERAKIEVPQPPAQKFNPETAKPIAEAEPQSGADAQRALYEADEFTSKAAVAAERAVVEWGKHVEEVVNPLKAKIRKLDSELGQMAYDAKRTKPEVKGKQHLTKKAFLEKYGVSSMEEANALYKQKNEEWANAEKELEAAEQKRKDLELAKERRGKEWSSAATRAGELRRTIYPKVKEGDVGKAEIIGMGGAVPSEFTEPANLSSIMFAAIDKDLAEMGKPPMKRGEPRTWDQDMQTATAKMNRDPQWIPDLLKEVSKNPRPLASWETMGVNLQKAYWKAQANDALKRLARAAEDGNEPELARAKSDAARFEDNLDELHEAVGRGGTGSEAGRSLQAQKIGLTDDLSLVEMRLEARGKLGRKLTDAESAKIDKLHKEYQEKLAALEKTAAEADKRRIDAETRATLAEIGRQSAEAKVPPPHIQRLIKTVGDTIHTRAEAARQRLRGKLFTLSPEVLKDLAEVGADNIWTIGEDFTKWSLKMVEDIGEHVKPHLAVVWEASKKLIEDTWKGQKESKTKKPIPPKVIELAKQTIKKGDSTGQKRAKLTARIADRFAKKELDKITPAVQRLARTFVEDGITEREALIDAVHEVLARIMPDWTRRNTMDAISGYGDYKTLSKDEISVKLRDLKGQMQQMAKLEDMAGGDAPLRSGMERREVTKAQSELIKLVNEAKRKGGYETTDPERQLRTALDEVKKRTQTQIEEYERRIAEKDYSVRKVTPVSPDSELLQKRADLKRTRLDWEHQKQEWEKSQRKGWQKFLDRFVRWERAFKLSSPVVFGKLAGAALTRFVETGVTETVGKGLRLVPGIREVAKQAPREGAGLNVKAAATALRSAWSKGMADAAQTLKKGAADLDVEYGEKIIDKDWINFFGQLHGMMKAPVKRAEFEYALQQRTEHAIRQGLDPNDPLVSARLHAEALNDGYRAIFMQRGPSSDAFNMMVNFMEKSKKHQPHYEIAARVARFLLPVVRVPINIVAETATGIYGAPVASVRTMTHAINGTLSKLDPVVADSIMRQFKKGSIGFGLLAVGYFTPQMVGGYDWREKRKPSDAKTGGFKVGDVDVPRWMTHAPWFELMQFGATIRHVKDQHVAKTGKEKGLTEGMWAAGLGLIEETPFVGQMLRVDKIFEGETERTRYVGELLRSTLLPQAVIKAAELADKPSLMEEAPKRKPTTIAEHLEMGIPGLRQNVPLKPAPRASRSKMLYP